MLLSGGLDSATVLGIAAGENHEVYALTIDYGQRHRIELERARALAASFKVKEHIIFNIPLDAFGGSALVHDGEVPKDRTTHEISHGIPVTYVPARNIIFLSLAVAFAEAKNCERVYIGVNAVDYSGYPDCRPEFIEAYRKMLSVGLKSGVEGRSIDIRTPLIQQRKQDIIAQGIRLGVNYALTISCYDPGPQGLSCGHCDSCLIRRKGFADLGLSDPLPYQS